MSPKQASTTTSADASGAAGVRPWALSSGSQVPPCGLGYSATVPRSGRAPSATRRSRAAARWRTSAAGSKPSGSSVTSSAPTSCASPQPAHSHIRSGRSGSGPGSSAAREQLAGGLLPQVEHQLAGGAAAEPAGDGRGSGGGDGVGQRRGGHALTVAPPDAHLARRVRPRCRWSTRRAWNAARRARLGWPGAGGADRTGRGAAVRADPAPRRPGLLQPYLGQRGARRGGDRPDVPAGLPVAQRPRRGPWDARPVGTGRGEAGAVRARRCARRRGGRAARTRRRSAAGRASRSTTSRCGRCTSPAGSCTGSRR